MFWSMRGVPSNTLVPSARDERVRIEAIPAVDGACLLVLNKKPPI